MKQLIVPTIIFILMFVNLFFFQSENIFLVNSVLLGSWLIYYYYEMKPAIVFLIISSLIFEILLFLTFGVYGLSFILTIIVVYVVQITLNLFKDENSKLFFLINLYCNTILFFGFYFIINREIDLKNLVLSLIVNGFIFILVTNLVQRERRTGYVT